MKIETVTKNNVTWAVGDLHIYTNGTNVLVEICWCSYHDNTMVVSYQNGNKLYINNPDWWEVK